MLKSFVLAAALAGVLPAAVAQTAFTVNGQFVSVEEQKQLMDFLRANGVTNEKQLKNLVLTKIDGVGKIRVKDIADITVVDNQGDAYSKVNGENAILLSVFKGCLLYTSDAADEL